MKRKKIVSLLMMFCILTGLLAGCGSSSAPAAESGETESAEPESAETESTGEESASAASSYPIDEVKAIVQWGAGGGTDNVLRPLAKLAQKELGVPIDISNMPGASGAFATEYVYYDANDDGSTILLGAENPQLYPALDLSVLTYSDFEPIILVGDEIVGIVVSPNSAYDTVTDLINAALAAPETITIATTGDGGLPWVVSSYLTDVTGATFAEMAYNSDADAKKSVVDGKCDFTICKVQIGIDDHKAGNLKFISMLSTEPVEQLEDVPLITEEYPDFENYLPWGSFYGVFVRKGTDQEIVDMLTTAFAAAYEDASYQELLETYEINSLGLTGDDAVAYLDNWKTGTLKSLVNSGAVEKSLIDLGIEE